MIHRVILLLVVAAAFGAAVPAAGVSLPVVPAGVSVGGVEVGGLISVQAERRIKQRFSQPLALFHGEKTWTISPGRLGASASIENAVAQAVQAREDARLPLDIGVDRRAVRRYVARLDKKIARPAQNAQLVGLSNLAPSFKSAKPGKRVDRPAMVSQIMRALRSTYRDVRLEVKVLAVKPALTARDYGPIIVIRRGSNSLYLYNGPQVVRSFRVATGQAQYPTPLGNFEIIIRERDPTWNPPDSDWAKDAKPIPPGPGNPLGTRWMGISSPAVGIHGTPDAASLGYSASHGCIRMAIPEAEWLFEQVEVGTPVYIVSA